MNMTTSPKILAAITGAIGAYLADEEASQAAALSGAGAGYAPGPPLNLWGLSGRSQAMQLRMLAQRRSLR